MDIRRRARRKPWIAKSRGRNVRDAKTEELIKPYANNVSDSSFYKTAAWRATREAVLVRDSLCVWCLHLAKVTPANEADHVIPKDLCEQHDISPYDQGNIVGSCRSCNSRRAAYSAKGIFFETLDKWVDYLRRKHIEKLKQ